MSNYPQGPPGSQGMQPPPGYPGMQPPPQQPRRRKRHGCLWTLAGAGVLIVLVIVIVAVAASHSTTTTGTATGAASSPAGTSGGLGSVVRDGKFSFTITKMTQAKTVGASGLSKTAQGEYAILHVAVTNIGNVAQTLDDSSQYVYDGAGRKFSADSTADLYISGNDVFFNTINPGNTVRGEIAFDLPAGDSAVKAELHDSAFSNGVTVRL
jgi:hypothetical protein